MLQIPSLLTFPKKSQTTKQIDWISKKVLELLDNSPTIEMHALLWQIKNTIWEVRGMIDFLREKYGTEYENYLENHERLLIPYEEIRKVLEQNAPQLSQPLHKLHQLIETFPQTVSQRMYEEIFWDLIMESGLFSDIPDESQNIPKKKKVIWNIGDYFLPRDTTHADFSWNKLRLLTTSEFQNLLMNLRDLKHLSITGTSLEYLEPHIETLILIAPRLTSLSVNYCNLGKFPRETLKQLFLAFQNLSSLDLTATGLHTLHEEELKELFSYLTNLKTLTLSESKRPTYVHACLSLPSLHSLTIRNSGIDTLSDSDLCTLFGYFPHLKALDIGAHFEHIETRNIFEHLQMFPHLRYLDISQTGLWKLSTRHYEALTKILPRLGYLNISENHLDRLSDKTNLDLLQNSLSNIESIKLRLNNFSEPAPAFFHLLSWLKKCQSIDLGYNHFREMEAEFYPEFGRLLSQRKEICLAWNLFESLPIKTLKSFFEGLERANPLSKYPNLLVDTSEASIFSRYIPQEYIKIV